MAKGKNITAHLTDEEYLTRLGARIRELRLAKGYTNQEIFAYESGIARAQYGKWEKGKNLEFLSLIRLIRIFDVTLEEFFGEGFE